MSNAIFRFIKGFFLAQLWQTQNWIKLWHDQKVPRIKNATKGEKRQIVFVSPLLFWVSYWRVITFNYLEPKNLFRNILHKIVHLWLFILKIYGDLEWLEFEAIVLWLLFSFPSTQVRYAGK